jgi:hypothetical protein
MAGLMELLNQRRGNRSYEAFANRELGISGSTLWRYDQGKTDIGIDALHKITQNAVKNNDTILLGAIISYATGLSAEVNDLDRIGSCLLELTKIPS